MNGLHLVTNTLRIIHLEDDPKDAELIGAELAESGIRCSITRVSTVEAFEGALRDGRIDLIISDSALPGFDTMQALSKAREKFPNLPFIFVSGNMSPKLKAKAFACGASGFISKSNSAKLARAVRRLFFAERDLKRVTLPEVGMPVIVQCEGFRCLGYFGLDGKWREYSSSRELPRVIGWSNV